MSKIIKVITLILVSSLILTGCSKKTNRDDYSIDNVDTKEEVVNEEAVGPIKPLENITYDKIYKLASDGGEKLETLLNEGNVEYYKTTDNLSLISAKETYSAYNQEYNQKFAYQYYLSNVSFPAGIRFEMEKEYHRDDEINVDDPYFKMFYESAKNYDKNLTEEALVKEINTLRLSEDESSNLRLYNEHYTEKYNNEVVGISVYDSKLKLKVWTVQPFTLEKTEIPVSEYATVSEFEDKKNKYEKDIINYSDRDLLSNTSLKPTLNIDYSNNLEGDLNETYSFNLSYLADSVKSESENAKERLDASIIPKEIIDLLPQFLDTIKENSGVDIRDYMTMEQFISEIQTQLTNDTLGIFMKSNRLPIPVKNNVEDNVNVNYSEDMSYSGVSDYPATNSITIKIYKNVIAEGKTRL